jgi:hypothetical protein
MMLTGGCFRIHKLGAYHCRKAITAAITGMTVPIVNLVRLALARLRETVLPFLKRLLSRCLRAFLCKGSVLGAYYTLDFPTPATCRQLARALDRSLASPSARRAGSAARRTRRKRQPPTRDQSERSARTPREGSRHAATPRLRALPASVCLRRARLQCSPCVSTSRVSSGGLASILRNEQRQSAGPRRA